MLSCTLRHTGLLHQIESDPVFTQVVIWVTRMLFSFFPACQTFLVSFSVYWIDIIYSGSDTIFDGIFSVSRCLLKSVFNSVFLFIVMLILADKL